MQKKKITRKLMAVLIAAMMAVGMFSTTSFAASETKESEPAADSASTRALVYLWDLGGFSFYNTHVGGSRTYNFNYMRIKPAWKATDSTTSEVELEVKVIDDQLGVCVYSHRFKLYEDVDGKDSAGWWYAESPYFRITYGHSYHFEYEAFTATGYQPTGNNRSAAVHMWLNLSDSNPG